MTEDERPWSVDRTAEWFEKDPSTIRRWVRTGWLDLTATGHVTAESIRRLSTTPRPREVYDAPDGSRQRGRDSRPDQAEPVARPPR